MARNDHSKVLWVEGKSDMFAIAELMQANGITWPESRRETPPVLISDRDSYRNIAKPSLIRNQLKSSNLTNFGIIVDADQDFASRWQSLRNACLQSIPDIPTELPTTGLLHTHAITSERQIKFGIWIMPDNIQQGMLETFLAYLLRDKDKKLWGYAQNVVQVARNEYDAEIKDAHIDKANIHTWLAWQDEPGLQLHTAVQKKVFDPQHPRAQEFVTWFKQLYDIEAMT